MNRGMVVNAKMKTYLLKEVDSKILNVLYLSLCRFVNKQMSQLNFKITLFNVSNILPDL